MNFSDRREDREPPMTLSAVCWEIMEWRNKKITNLTQMKYRIYSNKRPPPPNKRRIWDKKS